MTDCGALSVTVQLGVVPLQTPPHPTKTAPDAGVAVRVTLVPVANDATHAVPQVMPDGVETTVPGPERVTVTVGVNVALTETFAVIVTVHDVEMPEHPPLQPAKTQPAAGVAVSTTAVSLVNVAAHWAPHAMPEGLEATEPPPDLVTASVQIRVNEAVTVRAAVMDTVHSGERPLQSPLHPANVEPIGAADSVTLVPVS